MRFNRKSRLISEKTEHHSSSTPLASARHHVDIYDVPTWVVPADVRPCVTAATGEGPKIAEDVIPVRIDIVGSAPHVAIMGAPRSIAASASLVLTHATHMLCSVDGSVSQPAGRQVCLC
jgi:hypothetical protein